MRRSATRLACLALLLCVGCEKKPAGGTAPSTSASATPTGITPELAAKVLAKVGDHEITLGEYAATLGGDH